MGRSWENGCTPEARGAEAWLVHMPLQGTPARLCVSGASCVGSICRNKKLVFMSWWGTIGLNIDPEFSEPLTLEGNAPV